jgi:hypothetical protein
MTRRARWVVFAAVLIMSLSSAVVAMAGPPAAVRIEAPTIIGASPNPFTASGPAVDAGLICAIGKVHDISNVSIGPRRGRIRILRVIKRFECDDGSGTFDTRLIVRLNTVTHRTTASWRVISGTGDYASLRGGGRLVGTPIDPGVSINDVYTGRVR